MDLCIPAKSLPLLEKALEILMKIFANEAHLTVLAIKHSLGRYYHMVGQFDKSLETHHAILEILEPLVEANEQDDHILINSCKMEIAQVLLTLCKFDECQALISDTGRSVAILTGGKHYLVINSLQLLAKVLCGQHKYKDAEVVLTRALTTAEDIYGEFHPLVGNIYHSMAEAKRARGYYSEAGEKDDIGARICVNSYTPRNAHFAQSIFLRAQLARDAGKYVEANLLFEQALKDMAEAMGSSSYQFGHMLGAHGECQSLMGDEVKASATIQSAMGIMQKHFGKYSVTNSELMRSFALLQIRSDDPEKIGQAHTILRDTVVPMQEKLLGKLHPSTLFSKALQGLSGIIFHTPRAASDNSPPDSDSERYQDLIDDALDIFDRVVGLSSEHPWVQLLGGFLDSSELTSGRKLLSVNATAVGTPESVEENTP